MPWLIDGHIGQTPVLHLKLEAKILSTSVTKCGALIVQHCLQSHFGRIKAKQGTETRSGLLYTRRTGCQSTLQCMQECAVVH